MAAVAFQDIDHGYAALVQRVFAFERPSIHIGILNGDQPHATSSHGGAVEEAVTVLQVAIWNEFGTENIPARSFIRAWFDENEASLREDLAKLMQSVLLGKRTKEQILELLGQRAVAQIQARMSAGIAPANAPSTIRRKGSSTPLIDTSTLRSSVTYKVEG